MALRNQDVSPRDSDLEVPLHASAAEAAGWCARLDGKPDMPPKEYLSSRDDAHGWLRGWDMANNRLLYRTYRR